LWTNASATSSTTTATKHLTKDVAKAIATHVEVKRTTTRTTHGAHATHLVILSTLCCIAHYVVRSRDLFELLFGFGIIGVGVWVILTCKTSIRLRNVFIGRIFRHAKYGVVVLFEPLALGSQDLPLHLH
jgi:hypothetical protein